MMLNKITKEMEETWRYVEKITDQLKRNPVVTRTKNISLENYL